MITSDFLYWLLFAIPSILIASTIHEYAHGLAAFWLGDPTAKAHGRLTLNPLAHIDPVGALSMIIFKFGWSKPVPINEYNFRNREFGTAITSLAGPFSNLVVVLICAGINYIFNINLFTIGGTFFLSFITINLALAFFNLIPIPPLDGHKIVRAILPKSIRYHWEKLEKIQILMIIILVFPISVHGSLASVYMSFVIEKSLSILGFL